MTPPDTPEALDAEDSEIWSEIGEGMQAITFDSLLTQAEAQEFKQAIEGERE